VQGRPQLIPEDGGAERDCLPLRRGGAAATRLPTHIAVRRRRGLWRAFVQFYLFFLPADEPPRGEWQMVQVEFLKAAAREPYEPFTVGCTTGGVGQVRFFSAKARELNLKHAVYGDFSLAAPCAELHDKARPVVYVARGRPDLHFQKGILRRAAAGADGSACREVARAAALLPDVFAAYSEAMAPDLVGPVLMALDPTEADLDFVLDPSGEKSGGPAFWLGWSGRYGGGTAAPRGPRFQSPVARPGTSDDWPALSWWGHPDRFQQEFLRPEYEVRAVKLLRVNVTEQSVQFQTVAQPPPSQVIDLGAAQYGLATLATDGPAQARAARQTGEVPLMRLRAAVKPSPPRLRLVNHTRAGDPLVFGPKVVLRDGDFESLCAHLEREGDVVLEVRLGHAGPFPPLLPLGQPVSVADMMRGFYAWLDTDPLLVPDWRPQPDGMTESQFRRFLRGLGQSPRPVWMLLPMDRLQLAALRSLPLLPDEVLAIVAELFTVESGLIMFLMWLAPLLFGPPGAWAVFIVLGYQARTAVADASIHLVNYVTLALNATVDADLDRAAAEFAHFLGTASVAYFLVRAVLGYARVRLPAPRAAEPSLPPSALPPPEPGLPPEPTAPAEFRAEPDLPPEPTELGEPPPADTLPKGPTAPPRLRYEPLIPGLVSELLRVAESIPDKDLIRLWQKRMDRPASVFAKLKGDARLLKASREFIREVLLNPETRYAPRYNLTRERLGQSPHTLEVLLPDDRGLVYAVEGGRLIPYGFQPPGPDGWAMRLRPLFQEGGPDFGARLLEKARAGGAYAEFAKLSPGRLADEAARRVALEILNDRGLRMAEPTETTVGGQKMSELILKDSKGRGLRFRGPRDYHPPASLEFDAFLKPDELPQTKNWYPRRTIEPYEGGDPSGDFDE
jgi:hypothetical protein